LNVERSEIPHVREMNVERSEIPHVREMNVERSSARAEPRFFGEIPPLWGLQQWVKKIHEFSQQNLIIPQKCNKKSPPSTDGGLWFC